MGLPFVYQKLYPKKALNLIAYHYLATDNGSENNLHVKE